MASRKKDKKLSKADTKKPSRKKVNESVRKEMPAIDGSKLAQDVAGLPKHPGFVNQNDPELSQLLSISQTTLKNRFRDEVLSYEDQKDQLRYFLSKDYVRTYLSLKNRHRYFVMLFIRRFQSTLSELKLLVEKELNIATNT